MSERKFIPRAVALAAVGAVAFAGAACESVRDKKPLPPTQKLPSGFSRNKADYDWQIRVDISDNTNGNNFADLNTKTKPQLTGVAGASDLVADGVYCPTS